MTPRCGVFWHLGVVGEGVCRRRGWGSWSVCCIDGCCWCHREAGWGTWIVCCTRGGWVQGTCWGLINVFMNLWVKCMALRQGKKSCCDWFLTVFHAFMKLYTPLNRAIFVSYIWYGIYIMGPIIHGVGKKLTPFKLKSMPSCSQKYAMPYTIPWKYYFSYYMPTLCKTWAKRPFGGLIWTNNHLGTYHGSCHLCVNLFSCSWRNCPLCNYMYKKNAMRE